MENIDFITWISYFIIGVSLVILTYICICQQQREIRGNGRHFKSLDGNGKIYLQGRGHEDEDVELLLKRIYWSTYLRQRISNFTRIFLLAMTLTLGIVLFVYRDFPSLCDVIILILFIFICVFVFNNFFYVHGDIHNDGNIRVNIKHICSKLRLNIQFSGELPLPRSEALKRSDIE